MVDAKHPERLRELVQQHVYGHRVETPAMREGTEAHSILESMRRLDKDPVSVVNRIRLGERFHWSLGLCSVRYGLRGTPDAVLNEPNGKTLRLTIIDDKTHLEGRYFIQVWAYALILTDPNCLYTKTYDSESEEKERRPLYSTFSDIYDTVEVWATLNPYGKKLLNNPLPAREFSKGGYITFRIGYYSVSRSKKKILDAYYAPQLLAASQQLRFSMKTGGLVKNV